MPLHSPWRRKHPAEIFPMAGAQRVGAAGVPQLPAPVEPAERHRVRVAEDDLPIFRYERPLPHGHDFPKGGHQDGVKVSRSAHRRPQAQPGKLATPDASVIEHLYDALVENVAGRWWNGIWGRLGRRDVWLTREVRWKVVARAGDSENGRVLRWAFDTEADALAMVKRLLAADAGGIWRKQDGDAASSPPQ
ncbi:hypothetical protein [Micromonospora sp. NPDC049497]|uniref:hypothetical protein n=1 Tax=Micromonospora sp. NPDC049497 TaxID=3364273 RepID=UPI003798A481